MKLQTGTRLGLYAVLELARYPDRTLSAADLAERFGVSSHHLAKVLRTLGAAGLVRGAGYAISNVDARIRRIAAAMKNVSITCVTCRTCFVSFPPQSTRWTPTKLRSWSSFPSAGVTSPLFG